VTTLSTSIDGALDDLKSNRADKLAWGILYDKLWPYAYAIAFRTLSGDHAATEDICQNTFLRALHYMNFEKLDNPDDLIRYFSTMVHNSAIDFLKSRKEITSTTLGTANDIDFQDEAGVTNVSDAQQARMRGDDFPALKQMEAREQLKDLARQLTDRENQLLKLVGLGYSIEEVAAALGVSYVAAGTRIHRLRRRLHKLLTDKNNSEDV
jgi:RNA polymerase sigma factor (sigma-70 family)